ncbi:hypothetical protein [Solidesulfovibrio sp.]|jgi:hypothetical protein|uniref:hypothetical protein n=1 Tax=Solidesulfovibrio sp. TaxID=2910990 RepID=UPI000EDF9790|nr:hypothetical protein [Solidesulfovibrio sp.]MEA5090030.1 hypothetical protein [Solidesulfovibrio sp.]HCR14184.1 hypothetical protein [Desulfovibrio sp.]HML61873.1 hypothetical protein [Solidesulfovibrio sp.]
MKRLALLLAVAAFCAGPLSAQAASFSWSTPWSSGTVSGNGIASGSTSGSLTSGATTVDWSASLDSGSKTVSASATVNGQEYSGSFGWSDLFLWLFG